MRYRRNKGRNLDYLNVQYRDMREILVTHAMKAAIRSREDHDYSDKNEFITRNSLSIKAIKKHMSVSESYQRFNRKVLIETLELMEKCGLIHCSIEINGEKFWFPTGFFEVLSS